jgi:cholera toxin transcriptional activator
MVDELKTDESARRYRFGVFEADASTGELRRKGARVKLNAQPFQVLLLLLSRHGQVLTREQISRELWPEGTFVDYEHGVNAAVNRIRDALGDAASNPRFVETLARRGYRFIAPVEQIVPDEDRHTEPVEPLPIANAPDCLNQPGETSLDSPRPGLLGNILASPHELPETPVKIVRILFVLLQLMYVGFYVGALAPLPHATLAVNTLIATAAMLIPVRAFVLTAVFFHAPEAVGKILKIWPLLLIFDVLWSLSPFLLLHHINFGLALACTTLLVYSPFAQRSLVLMGAAGSDREHSTTVR